MATKRSLALWVLGKLTTLDIMGKLTTIVILLTLRVWMLEQQIKRLEKEQGVIIT